MTHPTFSPATSPQQLLEQFPVDFLRLTPLEQRVSIALYRLLADGEPVTLDRLTGAVSRPQHEIAAMLVMSFLRCDPSRVQEDVISNFCHYVFFFSSLEAGRHWVAEHPGTFLVSLADAFELAGRKNASQYPDVLR